MATRKQEVSDSWCHGTASNGKCNTINYLAAVTSNQNNLQAEQRNDEENNVEADVVTEKEFEEDFVFFDSRENSFEEETEEDQIEPEYQIFISIYHYKTGIETSLLMYKPSHRLLQQYNQTEPEKKNISSPQRPTSSVFSSRESSHNKVSKRIGTKLYKFAHDVLSDVQAYPTGHLHPDKKDDKSDTTSATGIISTVDSTLGPTLTLPQNCIDDEVRYALQKLRKEQKPDEDDYYKSIFLQSYFQSSLTDKKAILTMTGYKGMGSGALSDQINQDRGFILQNDNTVHHLMLGTYDGHGFKGEQVAAFCVDKLIDLLAEKLPPLLVDEIQPPQEDDEVKEAFRESFLEMDALLPTEGEGGSTASIIMQRNTKIYFANVGDSRSFIATYLNNEVDIIYITREDKCHLPQEKERIEAAGGEVTMIHEEGEEEDSRVYYYIDDTKKSMAMSRSIGDWDAKPFGILAEPIVDIVSLDINMDDYKKKYFCVTASDGLFNFISPIDIAQRVAKSLYHHESQFDHPLLAAEDLVVRAAQGWAGKYNGGRDDVTLAFSDISLSRWLQTI